MNLLRWFGLKNAIFAKKLPFYCDICKESTHLLVIIPSTPSEKSHSKRWLIFVPDFNSDQSRVLYQCEDFIKTYFRGVNVLRIEAGLSWAKLIEVLRSKGLQTSYSTYKKLRNGQYKTINIFILFFIADYFGKSFYDVYTLGLKADKVLK